MLQLEDYEHKTKLCGRRFTATGYGSKIPTSKMLRYRNRWHRIYCAIYSNVGSCYIISKGEKIGVN